MKNPPENDLDPFDPGQFELEKFLPYRLSLLTNTISQGMAQSYRSLHNISITEWRVLAVLGRFPGLSASEVVDRTAMDKVAISRAVKNLEEKGLLERRTDEEDRRRQNLVITQNPGQAVLSEVIPMAQRYETALVGALDEGELSYLLKLITKLQDSALALNPRVSPALSEGNKKSRE
jgi:DNA-binding MarR family transcriptional regulator